jgi:hypothetical protein
MNSINNLQDCFIYSDKLEYWCKANKTTPPIKCEKLKEKYIDYCKQNIQIFYDTIEKR